MNLGSRIRLKKGTDSNHQYKVMTCILTLKAPITTAADDIHKYFFLCFSEKIRLDISSESSARQRIHMKCKALFSSKDKSEKLKMSSTAIFVCRFKG